MSWDEHIKLGLALSGGAARGAAHIGVLEVLEAEGIRPSFIAGTSVGALVGALYSFGLTPAELMAIARDLSWSKISTFAPSRLGLLSNEEIAELVEEQVGKVRIEDAPIPLAIVATDIRTGEKIVFRQGDLAQAVMASSCIPGIYRPVEVQGRLLVDGFLVENVPVEPLRQAKMDYALAVNLGAQKEYRALEDIFDVILNAMEIAIDANTAHSLKLADMVVEPQLAKFSRRDPEHVPEMYREGKRAARAVIGKVKQQLKKRGRRGFWSSLWTRVRRR